MLWIVCIVGGLHIVTYARNKKYKIRSSILFVDDDNIKVCGLNEIVVLLPGQLLKNFVVNPGYTAPEVIN